MKHLPRVTVYALLALGAILIFYLLGHLSSGDEEAGAQAVREALHSHAAWLSQSQKLTTVAQNKAQQARHALSEVSALGDSLNRLEGRLGAIAGVRDSVVILVATVRLLTVQRDSAISAALSVTVAFRAESTSTALAAQRIATLETTLRGIQPLLECHVLGVRFLPHCPSRLASAGLGAGAVLAARLLR